MTRRGFTLLEVLVASVIGAFIAATAVATLRAVTASREKIDANVSSSAELRFAAEMIRKDLVNLYRDQDMSNVKLIYDTTMGYGGGLNVLTMHTVNRIKARPGEVEADVYEVEYFLAQNDEKSTLMRRLEPYPYEKEERGGIMYPVSEVIAGFEVRFLDGQSNEWLDTWSEENQSLPLLVEVYLAAIVPGAKNIVKNSFLVSFPRWPQASRDGRGGGMQEGGGGGRPSGETEGR